MICEIFFFFFLYYRNARYTTLGEKLNVFSSKVCDTWRRGAPLSEPVGDFMEKRFARFFFFFFLNSRNARYTTLGEKLSVFSSKVCDTWRRGAPLSEPVGDFMEKRFARMWFFFFKLTKCKVHHVGRKIKRVFE